MKELLVTIDDAPSERWEELLDILDNQNIKTIFFCIGCELQQKIGFGIRSVRNGHIIGNHSYTHKKFSKGNATDLLNEIKKTDEVIEQVYRDAAIPSHPKFFRFPYGDRGLGISKYGILFRKFSSRYKLFQNYLRENRYISFDSRRFMNPYVFKAFWDSYDLCWTCDLKEWDKSAKWDVLENRIKGICARPGKEILLIHDHAQTTELVERIFLSFRKFDASFIVPTQLLIKESTCHEQIQ